MLNKWQKQKKIFLRFSHQLKLVDKNLNLKNRFHSTLFPGFYWFSALINFTPNWVVTWSRKTSRSMWSIRSRWEWNASSVVRGTFSRYSTMNPSVTSSGNLISSPIFTNRPLLATGIIFIANALLIQKPAPPVANHCGKLKIHLILSKRNKKVQNLQTWFSDSLDSLWIASYFLSSLSPVEKIRRNSSVLRLQFVTFCLRHFYFLLQRFQGVLQAVAKD